MIFGFWKKISVPKDRVHDLIDELDQDSDGYISLGEVCRAAEAYAKVVKRDKRY